MSWRVIARKDVRDAGRAPAFWLLSGLLSLAFVGYAVGLWYVGREAFLAYVDGVAGLVGLGVPAVAILLGYKSIAGERSSGSLFLSLSFPHSRLDLALGKFVGRSVVLLAPTLAALAVAGGVAAALLGTDGLLWYPWFLAATALYGVAFVGVAVGLSMATDVDRTITLGALGGYVLLVQLWDDLLTVTVLLLHRFRFQVLRNPPDWMLGVGLAQPSEAYYRLLRAGFDVDRAAQFVGDGVPAYVDWPAALLLLVAWAAVPMAVGYWRFVDADL